MSAQAALLDPLFNQVFDYAGVAVFAASGALAAARKRQDLLTFAVFAVMTGVGGGTLRDLLLDVPVFWVAQPNYLVVCVAIAIAIWFWAPPPGRGLLFQGLLWLDAAGLAAYSVFGAHKALAIEVHGMAAVVMGVATAVCGGILRDVLAGEPSVLLRRELYATPALAGAAVYVVLQTLGVEVMFSAILSVLIAFAMRAGALKFGWALPAFHRH